MAVVKKKIKLNSKKIPEYQEISSKWDPSSNKIELF